MGCLFCGLMLVIAVMCALRIYSIRHEAANYRLALPQHIASRLRLVEKQDNSDYRFWLVMHLPKYFVDVCSSYFTFKWVNRSYHDAEILEVQQQLKTLICIPFIYAPNSPNQTQYSPNSHIATYIPSGCWFSSVHIERKDYPKDQFILRDRFSCVLFYSSDWLHPNGVE